MRYTTKHFNVVYAVAQIFSLGPHDLSRLLAGSSRAFMRKAERRSTGRAGKFSKFGNGAWCDVLNASQENPAQVEEDLREVFGITQFCSQGFEPSPRTR